MRPGGSARGANVALRPSAGNGDAEAVRPDEPRAVRADEREQLLLPLGALRADLGEAGGDDAERRHAVAQRRLGRVEHARARHADDGEVDRVGDLLDRRVRAHAGDRLAAAVDGVGGAGEVRGEDVAEELAADRAAARRRADHGDASRARRTARSDAATATWSRSSTRARNRSVGAIGKRTSTSPPSSVRDDLEARVAEDREHRARSRAAPRRRTLDPDLARRARRAARAAASPRRGPAARPRRRTRPRRRPDRAAARSSASATTSRRRRVRERADERAAVDPVGIEELLDERRVDVAHAVEAQVEAVLGEPLEERDEGARVVASGRPQSQGRAVAEDHVHRDGCGAVLDGAGKCLLASLGCRADRLGRRARPSVRASPPRRRTCRMPSIVSSSGK